MPYSGTGGSPEPGGPAGRNAWVKPRVTGKIRVRVVSGISAFHAGSLDRISGPSGCGQGSECSRTPGDYTCKESKGRRGSDGRRATAVECGEDRRFGFF